MSLQRSRWRSNVPSLLLWAGVSVLPGCITMGQLEEWNAGSRGSGGSNTGCAVEQVNAGTALGEISSGSTRGCRSNFSDCDAGRAPDVEVSWRAPYEGCFSFTTTGSSFDTQLLVFDGGGSLLECDDDDGEGSTSWVVLCVDNNAQLYVVVDGDGSSQGSYRLQVEEVESGFGSEDGDDGTADQGPDVGTPVAVTLSEISLGAYDFLSGVASVPCEGCTFSLEMVNTPPFNVQTLDFYPAEEGGVYVYANGDYMGLGALYSSGASWYGYRTFYAGTWYGDASW